MHLNHQELPPPQEVMTKEQNIIEVNFSLVVIVYLLS